MPVTSPGRHRNRSRLPGLMHVAVVATTFLMLPTSAAVDSVGHDAVTARVSVPFAGGEADGDSANPSISADGRYVAFESHASNLVPITGPPGKRRHIYVYDRKTSQTTRASMSSTGEAANQDSANPSISADGRYVAFESRASNLASGTRRFGDDEDEAARQVYVHDRQTGQTTRVSISRSEEPGEGNEGRSRWSADQ